MLKQWLDMIKLSGNMGHAAPTKEGTWLNRAATLFESCSCQWYHSGTMVPFTVERI
jgi:hypothetical protein